MVVSVKHKFTSTTPDSADTSLIRPSNWNDEHDIVMATARLLGRGTAGTGAAEEISLGSGLSFTGTTLNYTLTSGGITGALGYTPVNKSGDIMTGELQTPYPICYGPAETERAYRLRTGASDRWMVGASATPEAGANSGSDFFVARYNDAGGWIASTLVISRATGTVYIDTGTGPYSLIIGGNVQAAGFYSNGRTLAPEIMLRPYGADTYRWRFIQGAGGEMILQGSNDLFTTNFLNAGIFDVTTGKLTLDSGLVATRNVTLGAGTDFNVITASGDYDGHSPINGPYLSSDYWYLEVKRYSGNADYVLQRASLLTGVNPNHCTWQRSKKAGAWGPWLPTTGYVTPEHYGAIGDGVADDTVPVGQACRSGLKVGFEGLYRITSAILCGAGYNAGTTAVHITGKGKTHLINDHTGDCLTIALETNPSNYPGLTIGMATLKDFGIRAKANNNQAAGIAIYGVGGSGSTAKSMEIHNVRVDGESDTKGFAFGMWLSNARNFLISGCTVQSKRSQTLGSQIGVGIHVGGNSDPVDGTITDCDFYFGSTGVKITDTCEGMIIRGPTVVGADVGIWCDVHENPISGDDGGKQLLHIDGGHINSVLYGVKLERVWGWKVTNVDMLCWQANSNWQGLYAKVDSAADMQGWVDGCAFRDMTTGAVSSGTTIGVNIEGFSSGVLRTRIGMNSYTLLRNGIYIGANAKEVRWAAAQVFAGCVSTVTNTGGGTNTAY